MDKGDGLEAWRRVLEDVAQKTRVEVLDPEKAVMHPSPGASPEQVATADVEGEGAADDGSDASAMVHNEELIDEEKDSDVAKAATEGLVQSDIANMGDLDAFETESAAGQSTASGGTAGAKSRKKLNHAENASKYIKALDFTVGMLRGSVGSMKYHASEALKAMPAEESPAKALKVCSSV